MFPIITVSGVPGSGKTTLSSAIAAHYQWQRIAYDDYEGLTTKPEEIVEQWLLDGMPFDQLFLSDCKNAVLSAAQTSVVIFETPLGRLHEQEGIPVSHAFWLDCKTDTALARSLLKEVRADDWRTISELQNWTTEYLNAYTQFVSLAIEQQQRLVQPLSDTVIDSNWPTDAVIATARNVIDKFLSAEG